MRNNFIQELDSLIKTLHLPKNGKIIVHAHSNQAKQLFQYGSDDGANKTVHIWEDVWHSKPDIIKSRLQSLAAKSKRIHARATQIKRIDKKTADSFLIQNHLQGATNAYYKFGLYHKEEMVAVATFSKSRVMHDGAMLYRSYEWERFANKNGFTVVGGMNKLLKHFLQLVHAQHIMTYIDKDWSDGSGYQKIGFKIIDETPPQTYWVKQDEWIRYSENNPPEEVLKGKLKQYFKVHNSGSIKMILDLRR